MKDASGPKYSLQALAILLLLRPSTYAPCELVTSKEGLV